MSFWRAAFELLLPPVCAGCGHTARELPLCTRCRLPAADADRKNRGTRRDPVQIRERFMHGLGVREPL